MRSRIEYGMTTSWSFLLVITLSAAQAQTVRLKPIQVIAQKNVENFFEKDIKRQSTDDSLIDVLTSESDLSIVRDGGVAGRSSIFIRGGNAQHTGLIVDGMNAANTVDASTNFSDIYLSEQKITLIKGPLSAKYGADAIMGAVKLVTPEPIRQNHHAVNVELGKNWHQKTAYLFEHAKGKTGILFHINQQSTKGTVSKPRGQRRTFADSQREGKSQYDGYINVVQKLNDLWRVKAYVKQDRSRIQYLADYPTSHMERGEMDSNVIRTSLENNEDDAFWQPTFRFSHQRYQRVDHDISIVTMNRRKNDSIATEFSTENAFKLKSLVFHLNVNSRDEALYQMDPPAYRINRHAIATGAEYEWGRGSTSNFWYRFNRTNRGHQSHDLSSEHQVAFEKITLFGMMGLAHRAPTLIQLYDKTYGNAQLKSEENLGLNFGYVYDFVFLKLKQSYFQNALRNMIIGDPTVANRNQNISRAETEGLETEISVPLTENLRYSASHTYLFTKDLTKRCMLSRRPLHKLVQQIHIHDGDWRWDLGIVTVGKQLDFDPAINAMRYRKGYSTVNLTSEYQLSKSNMVYGKIENVLARRYQSPLGYEQPGFSFIVGLKIVYSK